MEKYEVEVFCNNCGFSDYIKILKGLTVSETECTNCKCKELRRR